MGMCFFDAEIFFIFWNFTPSKQASFLHYGEKKICVIFSERRNFMKHKFKIGISKNSQKSSVVVLKGTTWYK